MVLFPEVGNTRKKCVAGDAVRKHQISNEENGFKP
jgi:hypothetical protein